ncbi:MAG: GGDEF domain-containing protein [Bryobacteraceae bacterium]|jgi:diguanylate cyclase (GGDEF)-like protein
MKKAGQNPSMPILLSFQQKRFLQSYFYQFTHQVTERDLNPIYEALQYRKPPPAFRDYQLAIDALSGCLQEPERDVDRPFELDDRFAPLLKAVLLACRRTVAEDVDRRRAKTLHPEALAALNAELSAFDEFASQPWYRQTSAFAVPRLAEYLTLEEVERVLRSRNVRLQEREFDEKFHLLQAPRLLLPDVVYYREMSGVRGNPVALAFVDIDDFKRLNTDFGHHMVDLRILPVFMRALEAFTFARGFAYRMGGDEYAVLLGNGRGALGACEELRQHLSALRYDEIPDTITVSVGMIVLPPDSELSDMAVLERANRAMRFAKDHGKDRIATYVRDGFADEHLTLWPTGGIASPS